MTLTLQRRFLRFKDLEKKGIPWTRMHVDRLEKVSKFPKRVQLGPGTVAWVEDEIDTYVAGKIADRDAQVRPNASDPPGMIA
jgi:prophage regulatory protein